MERMLLLKADVTANHRKTPRCCKRFGLFGPPGTIFFDASGKQLAHARHRASSPPSSSAASLDAVLQPAS